MRSIALVLAVLAGCWYGPPPHTSEVVEPEPGSEAPADCRDLCRRAEHGYWRVVGCWDLDRPGGAKAAQCELENTRRAM